MRRGSLKIAAAAIALVPAVGGAALTLESGHVYSTSSAGVEQFDSFGVLVGSIEVPGGDLRGIAIGPDDLFYVVQHRENYPAVIVLTLAGELVREIPFPAHVWQNSGYGRLCFDYRRRIGYVTSGAGMYRFSVAGGFAEYLHPGGFGCSVLPNGDYLVATGDGISRLRDGEEINYIRYLVDENNEEAEWWLSSSRGVHYSEAQNVTYATTYNGYRLFKLRGVSNVLLGETYFHYGSDVAELPDGKLVVGSSTVAAGFFDPDLLQIGELGSPGLHVFVTGFPSTQVIFFSSFD